MATAQSTPVAPSLIELGMLTDAANMIHIAPNQPTAQDLVDAGYNLLVCTTHYEVWFGGELIGKGHSESTLRKDTRPSAVRQADMRQCAVWVAERHYRRHNARHGIGKTLD